MTRRQSPYQARRPLPLPCPGTVRRQGDRPTTPQKPGRSSTLSPRDDALILVAGMAIAIGLGALVFGLGELLAYLGVMQ